MSRPVVTVLRTLPRAITAECEKLIEQGYLIGSRMIRAEHVCKSFEDASAIYISAVYGRDMSTRGFVVYLLRRDLRHFSQPQQEHLAHLLQTPLAQKIPDAHAQ